MSHRHFSRNNEACIVTADVKIEARENREPEPSGHRRRGDSDISPAKSWPGWCRRRSAATRSSTPSRSSTRARRFRPTRSCWRPSGG